MPEFYMSDYMQLGFYCEDHIMIHRDGSESRIGGYNTRSSDGVNYIMLNLFYIGKQMRGAIMERPFIHEKAKVFLGDKELGTGDVTVTYIRHDDIVLEVFLDWFWMCWWHEYLHLIGFSEEQVHFMTETDVHVIEIDVEDEEDD